MNGDYTYRLVFPFGFKDKEVNVWIKWLSYRTHEEPDLLNKTMKDIKKAHLLVFVFDGDALIGAAGIFHSYDEMGNMIYHGKRLVVEFGTLYVLPPYRRDKIGDKLLEIRKYFVRMNKFFPVVVTKNLIVSEYMLNGSKVILENFPEYIIIESKIRFCPCRRQGRPSWEIAECQVCPRSGKMILGYSEFA